FHIDRVTRMAMRLGAEEECDLFVVEMAALLHDLEDWKLIDADRANEQKVNQWLNSVGVDPDVSASIIEVIDQVSYKGAGVDTPVLTIEAAVVQDADRLDAIGAIGVARTFAYGGHKNRLIYDPEVKSVLHADFQEYKKSTAPTINHFYEKLLLLKDRMHTASAKRIAVGRHQFMVEYLTQFYDEWNAVR
ncbi:HD domain-containing protein, partial [bacterium]